MHNAVSGKILLITGGIFLGVLFGGALGYALKSVRAMVAPQVPDGSTFASVDDLRRAMVERNSQDLKEGENVSLRSLMVPHPDDRIIYDLAANMNVRFQGVSVQTNSCGLRGPERPVAKADDVYRIALLGDSFAFGWGVEQKQSFAQILEDRLNEFTEGKLRVEVINFGVPGYSTFQEVERFIESGQEFDPDAILVYYVDNDFNLPFFVPKIDSASSLSLSTDFHREATENKDNKEATGRANRLKNGLNPNRALMRLTEFASAKGVPVFLAVNPRKQVAKDISRLWVIRRNPLLHFIALREDLLQIVAERQIDVNSLILSKQDPHPSAIKHKIFGELFAKHFMPEVAGYLPQ